MLYLMFFNTVSLFLRDFLTLKLTYPSPTVAYLEIHHFVVQ